MPCETVKLDELTVFICHGGPRRKPKLCPFCRKREATLLCDHPDTRPAAKPGATCDNPICGSCATGVGPDRDYCPVHRAAALQGALNFTTKG
jgi:hypothetical protein